MKKQLIKALQEDNVDNLIIGKKSGKDWGSYNCEMWWNGGLIRSISAPITKDPERIDTFF
jgi:hypothetical protein